MAKISIQALQDLTKKAKAGDVAAMILLGDICYETPRDLPAAYEWWSMAAQRQDPEGCYRMGLCCANGEGVTQDVHQAFNWFDYAAVRGHVEALNSVAFCYWQEIAF